MYQSFYSLSGTPFTKEVEAKRFFASVAFSEAEGRLEYLKKTRGIGMVTGEPGAGKTLILRVFTERLSKDLYKIIYFPLSPAQSWIFTGESPGALGKSLSSTR